MTRKISKNELIHFVESLKYDEVRKTLSSTAEQILYTLEHIHYVDVLNKIKKRRDQLDLFKPNDYITFYIPKNKTNKDISISCVACLRNKINHVRPVDYCNCKCDFCYYYGKGHDIIPKWAYLESMMRRNLDKDELKLMFQKQVFGKAKAIGWLNGEPLLVMEKMKPIMKLISDNETYQYLYTNGVYANETNLKKLADWGLNEIRFNLQATDFSPDVLSNMENACKIIDNVCIETPIYSKSFNNFVKYIGKILQMGIKQINMPELQINGYNLNLFKKEGPIYRHRRGYVSPISSRHKVYDLIEMAIKNEWDVIINDCSNDTKFYRGVAFRYNDNVECGIVYNTQFKFLPVKYYLDVINEFIDVEMEY